MAEYERIMAALRNAHEAGDTDAARRLAQMAREARQHAQASTISDVGQSLASGAMRGVGGLLDLPSTAIDLLGRGAISAAEMGSGVFGYENPQGFQSARDVWSTGRAPSAQSGIETITGGFSEREPQTTAGQYARTVGEFMPGALLGGGGSIPRLLRYGVAPGLASEAAGQATEGMSVGGVDLEPIARIGAAVATPSVIGRAISPFGGADPSRVAAAQRLRREGVDVRAGEQTGSAALRRAEGSLEATPQQMEQFTSAAMRSIGSRADRANPAALQEAERRIVSAMDDVLQSTSVQATPTMAQRAVQVADDYLQNAPAGAVVPRVRALVDDILDAATNPRSQAISLERMRLWRSGLGRMTQSADEATRHAAIELRGLIDEATDSALISAGRMDDISRLSEARTQYRNLLAVQDAATRAGAEGGVLSPMALNQSVIRTQGRRAYAMGTGTDAADLSRAGAQVLRSEPTVQAGGARSLPQLTQGGMTAGMGALGYQFGGVPGAVAGGVLGSMTPAMGRALVGTAPIQAYLRNQAMGAAAGLLSPERLGVTSINARQ